MRTIFTNAISAVASVGFTVLAVAASAPAAAVPVDQAPRAIVQTADLNLATATGHRVAMRRIGGAAGQVCDASSGNSVDVANCRANAIAGASAALDRMNAPAQVALR